MANKFRNIWLYFVSTASMLANVAAQSIAFLVVARYLGKTSVGQLATLTAVTSVCSSWIALGTPELARRRLTQNRQMYPEVLGHCILILFLFGSVATVVISTILAKYVRFSDDGLRNFLVVLQFALCAFIFYPWMVIVEQIFLARNSYAKANLTSAGFGVWRALVALAAFLVFGVHSFEQWAVWNFATYAVASAIGALAISPFGAPVFRILRNELVVGATFGVSGFLYNLRASVNILALSLVSPPEVVGSYGVARRVVGIAIVTSASLDRLIYSRLVMAAQRSLRDAVSTATSFAGYALLISGVTALALYVLAPLLIPQLFGPSYKDAVSLTRYLCGAIIVISLQNLGFDVLNSANLHRLQVSVSAVCVVTGVAGAYSLTRAFLVPGAIAGVYLIESILAIALWASLFAVAHPRVRSKTNLLLTRIRPFRRA